MTTKQVPRVLGRIARYGGRCSSCQKWTYAQTRRQWQRAVKQPCPRCGMTQWCTEAS